MPVTIQCKSRGLFERNRLVRHKWSCAGIQLYSERDLVGISNSDKIHGTWSVFVQFYSVLIPGVLRLLYRCRKYTTYKLTSWYVAGWFTVTVRASVSNDYAQGSFRVRDKLSSILLPVPE